MVHISPWDATLGLIKGAAAILPPTSPFYLYGPYKRLRLRKQDKDERDEQESLLDLYLRAMESAGWSQARAA